MMSRRAAAYLVTLLAVACSSAGESPTPDAGSDAAPSPDGGSQESGPLPDGSTASGTWLMGYYPSWDTPHNGGAFPVSSIDWDALTHVAAAFYIPDAKGNWLPGYFDQATADELIAAAHAHARKVIASIGGADSGAAFETAMQSANLSTFLASLQALLTQGYDGVDIDWEGGTLSAAQTQTLQTSLVQSLRAANPNAILTFTAGYQNENSLDDLSFYGAIAPQVDRINLMTYGMAGAWQGWKSWHTAPLHWNKDTSTPTGIDASVAHYIAAGVPAAKLGVGAGFYGMCYTTPVTAPSQALGASQVAASDGTMSYTNIMASYWSAQAYHYDSAAEAPYLTLSGSNAQKCTYVSYEDATSLAAKAAWIKAQGLGGIIVWTITEGFVASGATLAQQNPLLEALKAGL